MELSISQVSSAGHPAVPAQPAPTRSSVLPIRVVRGTFNLVRNWLFAQVTILPGSSDQTVARVAMGAPNHFDTIKWNAFARHYGARQVQ